MKNYPSLVVSGRAGAGCGGTVSGTRGGSAFSQLVSHVNARQDATQRVGHND